MSSDTLFFLEKSFCTTIYAVIPEIVTHFGLSSVT